MIFENMIGRTMARVDGGIGDEVMTFYGEDGSMFRFWYDQDCCATCSINDIAGDLSDLVGTPIVQAELVESEDFPAPENADSYTWSFYKFRTIKGDVTVRWLGESNGYYSETVSFEERLTKED